MTRSSSRTGRSIALPLLLALCLPCLFATSVALGDGLTNVANVAALRATTLVPENEIVYLEGYFKPGDGGQGMLIRLRDGSTDADDGVCIFVTAGGHRYYRESCETSVTPGQAGARADRTLIAADDISAPGKGNLVAIAGAHFSNTDIGKEIILPTAKNAPEIRSRIEGVIDGTHIRLGEPLKSGAQYACRSRSCWIVYGHDDASAFERLMASADRYQSPVQLGSREYLLGRGIVWNNTRSFVQGSGAVLDFSLMKGGAAATISVSGNYAARNEKIGRVISRPNGGFTIMCNWRGAAAGAGTGLTFAGLDATGAPSVTVANVSLNNCNHGIELAGSAKVKGAGLTDVTLDRIRIQSSQYGIYAAPGIATGSEKISIVNSFIVNNREAGIYLGNPYYDMQIADTSIDGSKTGIHSEGSEVEMQGGHMEAIVDYYADAASAGAAISMSNVSIAVNWTRSNPLFHTARPTSSVNLDHDIIGAMAGVEILADEFETGPGRFVIRDPVVSVQGASGPLPLFSVPANAIANGEFSRPDVAGWHGSTASAVAVDREIGHSRPGSLRISEPSSISYAFACRPGAYAGVQGYFRTDGLKRTGGELRVSLSWQDAAGRVIGAAAAPKIAGDLSTWTRLRLLGDVNAKGYAPPGTSFAALSIDVEQARPGKLAVWADDINGFCY